MLGTCQRDTLSATWHTEIFKHVLQPLLCYAHQARLYNMPSMTMPDMPQKDAQQLQKKVGKVEQWVQQLADGFEFV